MGENPLGKFAGFPTRYAPELLHPIPRAEARSAIGIASALPFRGDDIWNAWELSWLDVDGKPSVATLSFRVPAESPNIIESKSLKLYLNSFSMTSYATTHEIGTTIAADLSAVAGCDVTVSMNPDVAAGSIARLPGECIDAVSIDCDFSRVDPSVLTANAADPVFEEIHSHLLRSKCPVTNQPDSGSILIRYDGGQIDRRSLLRYLVSYREHNDFHEACAERIFVDIKSQCAPTQLTVCAYYNRRGGIDINPSRSDFEDSIAKRRLWRQ